VEENNKKPPKTYRIITLGDSHTFGHFVSTEQNYPEKLEAKLSAMNSSGNFCRNKDNVEVINLGMMGYDVEYSIHRFNNRGAKYHPDLIIWFLKADDITQILEQMSPIIEELEAKLLEKDPKLYDDPIARYEAWHQAEKELLIAIGADEIINYNSELIKKFLQDNNLPIIFLTYKEDYQTNTLLNSYTNQFPSIRIFSELLEAEIDRLADGHPSSPGYSYLVTKLTNYLVDNQDWFCEY